MWRFAGSDKLRGGLKLLAAVLVIDAVVLAAFVSSEPRYVYQRAIPELVSDGGAPGARVLRVEGLLVRGSLYRLKDRCEFRFRLAAPGGAHELEVRYAIDEGILWARRDCVLPDTFCDAPGYELTATVEGTLERDERGLYFTGTQIMAKCPGKYELRGQHGPQRCPPIPVRA